MRSFVAIALGLVTPIVIGAFVACGPPSSFDNLTGVLPNAGTDAGDAALVPDETLEPPRPVAPLAHSYVNGLRPTLRWALTPPATGARVTLCGDARCEGAKKRSYPATGTELTVPDDLEPGVWYWRLASTTAGSIGSKESRTLSLLVRGGTPGGAPAGSYLDMNGDGLPDLFVFVELADPSGASRTPVVLLGTNADDPTAVEGDAEFFIFYSPSATTNIDATDIDGDGLSDLIVATDEPGGSGPGPFIDVLTGANDSSGFDDNFRLIPPSLPPYDVVPNVVAPGDLDGDGNGDLLVSTTRTVAAVFGQGDGFGPISFIDNVTTTPPPDAGAPPRPTSPIALGGHDVDPLGRAGFAVASYYPGPPLYLLRGEGDRFVDEVPLGLADGGPPLTPATRFASGDYDGDGKTDLAFATTAAGKPSICLIAGAEPPEGAKVACWSPDAVPDGFATSLVTADLEGDGKDEILVSATTGGVSVLSVPAPGQLTAEQLAIDHGTRLTVLYPGRPKPAVWAASRADGASIGLYRGKERVRVLAVTDVVGPEPGAKFDVSIR